MKDFVSGWGNTKEFTPDDSPFYWYNLYVDHIITRKNVSPLGSVFLNCYERIQPYHLVGISIFLFNP